MAAVGLLGCHSPGAPAPELLRLSVVLDGMSYRYAEPVAWRVELQNVGNDSVAISPGTLFNGFQYRLAGPAGDVPRMVITAAIVGPPIWLRPGEKLYRFGQVYTRFVIDETGDAILPALPTGMYQIRADFDGTVTRAGEIVAVALSTSARLEVIQGGSQYSDSLHQADAIMAGLIQSVRNGEASPESVAVRVSTIGAERGMPLWYGVSLLRVAAQLRSQSRSARTDSVLEESMESYILAHPTHAFSAGLLASLEPGRRNHVCEQVALRVAAGTHVRVACALASDADSSHQ